MRTKKLFDRAELDKSRFADAPTLMKNIIKPIVMYKFERLKPLVETTVKKSYMKKPAEVEFCISIEDKTSTFNSNWYVRNSKRNQNNDLASFARKSKDTNALI